MLCRYDVEHPVVNDADMSLWYALGIASWPTQVVVSPTGKLLLALPGEGRKADIDACIQAALEHYGEAGLLVTSDVPVVRPPQCMPRPLLQVHGKPRPHPATPSHTSWCVVAGSQPC